MSVGKETVLQTAHEYLKKGELHKAVEYFERATKESDTSVSTKSKISCFLNAGACLISLGKYNKGLVYLGSAANIISTQSAVDFQKGNVDRDKEVLEITADIHYNSAIAYQSLRDYEQAVNKFQQCIDLYIQFGYLHDAAEVLSGLASCHLEAGQPENERACLNRARALYKQLNDHCGEAMVCVDLARSFLRVGRKEECKQMLSTAKMISLRVENQHHLGKIHLECGLLHSCLCQYDDALQCFKQALPLVRAAGNGSQLLEASLLQNIGATYNEKLMYSESLVYHREAAAIHGKLENCDSEVKCLCNLAFAQSQLGDYTSSATSFTEALDRAHTSQNTYLQFQACEGLGGCYYHLNQYTDAVSTFNTALQLLDKIEEDTSIAKERVMEKLSDATEALQRRSEGANESPSIKGKSPEHSQLSEPHRQENSDTRESQDRSVRRRKSRKSQPLSPENGKREEKEVIKTRPTTLVNQDSCDIEIQAYEETLVSVSSIESSDYSSADHLDGSHEHTDHPGSSTRRTAKQHALTPISSLSQGQSINYPQPLVTEGCLALGHNARDIYTTQSSQLQSRGRRKRGKGVRVVTEIVQKEATQQAREASTEQDGLATTHSHISEHTRSNSLHSAQGSRVCTIL